MVSKLSLYAMTQYYKDIPTSRRAAFKDEWRQRMREWGLRSAERDLVEEVWKHIEQQLPRE